jgi:hypothetical protein
MGNTLNASVAFPITDPCEGSDEQQNADGQMAVRAKTEERTIVVEICAAYNREGLTMPRPNGPNGKRVLDLEMLMNSPVYWEWLNERETEEALMEMYIQRTRKAQ